ncbi:hypothetical protein ACIQVK_29630 [Streptomyces sp. NPDC090493]|uniref:hypothetical protein n=1 Tax=Streptomyces sp. NPDC090493 TaxID=3365964 RepID=UPI003830C6D5
MVVGLPPPIRTLGAALHITVPTEPPAEPAPAHPHGLERAPSERAEPPRTPAGSPLVGA